MKKNFLTIAVLSALLFSACGDNTQKEEATKNENSATEQTENPATETVEKEERNTQILGKFEQITITAPNQYRNSEYDVEILPDPNSGKKVLVKNLIPNATFYAVKNTENEESVIYTVPAQTVGNYQINMGCVIYTKYDEDYNSENDDPEDDDSKTVLIALNNRSLCMGISQTDDDGGVSVGKDGVSAGGVKVGSNGNVVVGDGVSVGSDGIKINTKKLTEGIQYVGRKYQ